MGNGAMEETKVIYCEVCGCFPCDCHGVKDELWGMVEKRTDQGRQDNVLDGQEVGSGSKCPDKVETRNPAQHGSFFELLCHPCRYSEEADKWGPRSSSQDNGSKTQCP